MLPIVLVLLVAASAIAGPAQQIRINQIPQGDSRGNDNSALGKFFQVLDHGSLGMTTLSYGQILRDLSATSSSTLANAQGIIAVGELATGRPGDSCAASNLVNTYVNRVQSGNIGNLRNALNSYIQNVNSKIDNIVTLITKKDSARFSSGTQSGCPNEGRVYQFEAAWDSVLGNAPSNQVSDIDKPQRFDPATLAVITRRPENTRITVDSGSLFNEAYCASKRLYCTLSATDNNLAAQLTASALPVTQAVFKIAARPLANFVQAFANGGSSAQAAGALKQALSQAAARIEL